jgi:hypothetical protein
MIVPGGAGGPHRWRIDGCEDARTRRDRKGCTDLRGAAPAFAPTESIGNSSSAPVRQPLRNSRKGPVAEMHPSSPLKGALSNGERKVFFACKTTPRPSRLHGVALLTRPRGAQRLYSEIDLPSVTPHGGCSVIEVRRQRPAMDEHFGRWRA